MTDLLLTVNDVILDNSGIWIKNIDKIYHMINGLSNILVSYYNGEFKANLSNYLKFIDEVRTLSNTDKAKVLKHSVLDILSMYHKFHTFIDIEDMIFMCDYPVTISTKKDSSTFIPLSECYILAFLKKDSKLLEDIDGCILTLIYLCKENHTKRFTETYSLYKTDEKVVEKEESVSNTVDTILSNISDKITINDPVLRDKLYNLSDLFKDTLKVVAETSVLELEKSGADINDDNGNLSLGKLTQLIPKLMHNNNIKNTVEVAIDKLGRDNVQKAISDVMT